MRAANDGGIHAAQMTREILAATNQAIQDQEQEEERAAYSSPSAFQEQADYLQQLYQEQHQENHRDHNEQSESIVYGIQMEQQREPEHTYEHPNQHQHQEQESEADQLKPQQYQPEPEVNPDQTLPPDPREEQSIVRTAAGKKLFKCMHSGCGKVFSRREHLKRHGRSLHSEVKPYVCPYPRCAQDFSRFDNLRQHAKKHGNIEDWPAGARAVFQDAATSSVPEESRLTDQITLGLMKAPTPDPEDLASGSVSNQNKPTKKVRGRHPGKTLGELYVGGSGSSRNLKSSVPKKPRLSRKKVVNGGRGYAEVEEDDPMEDSRAPTWSSQPDEEEAEKNDQNGQTNGQEEVGMKQVVTGEADFQNGEPQDQAAHQDGQVQPEEEPEHDRNEPHASFIDDSGSQVPLEA